MTTSSVTLKLLVDKNSNTVLFAEASKEFVNFLFYILSLLVATVVSVITTKGMVGCLGNLYESIENLSTNYIQPNFNKDCILKPKVVNTINVNLLLPDVESSSSTCKNFYRCNNNQSCEYVAPGAFGGFSSVNSNLCRMYVADKPSAICPSCKNLMNVSATYVAPPVSNTTNSAASSSVEKGFVKGVVTYTVMDDLVVKPMSAISSITLLASFNIKDIGLLEEKEITFGMDEAVKLIKSSLESKTVLTDVFLANKNSAHG